MFGNPTIASPLAAPARGRRPLLTPAVWFAAAVLESCVLAYSMGRVLFGPVSITPSPFLWAGWVAVAATVNLGLSVLATAQLRRIASRPAWVGRVLLATTLPFLAFYVVVLAVLQLRPDAVKELVWSVLSPIEPFPTMAMAIWVLAAFTIKLAIPLAFVREPASARAATARAADIGIVALLVVIGILLATVYIIPIGNAFLRSWAIADAVMTGTKYPVTDTELPTLLAGGPPFIRDLPLFPLMLLTAFAGLGHTTAAAHLPAMLASAFFPLALYLLLLESTRERVLSLLFAALTSTFPFLRYWVLNLPDPDPLMLTFLCLAGLLYLRAARSRVDSGGWLAAGIACGLLSLIRSEGILYAACIGLGVLALRPGMRRVAAFVGGGAIFVAPMVAVWLANFGILWPQNFNGTLGLNYPLENLQILQAWDAFGMYERGLGLGAASAAGMVALCALSVVAGTVVAAFQKPRLLALLVPGMGNFISIFFTSPGVTNAQHFADFFRHASFGIPFMVVASAVGVAAALRGWNRRTRSAAAGPALAVLLLLLVVVRESDILANPTATHRPGATQVLTTSTHLSMQTIVERPMDLPLMTYRAEGDLSVAYPTFMKWPDGLLQYFAPFDMTFDSAARPFGYAAAIAVAIALALTLMAQPRMIRAGGVGQDSEMGDSP